MRAFETKASGHFAMPLALTELNVWVSLCRTTSSYSTDQFSIYKDLCPLGLYKQFWLT